MLVEYALGVPMPHIRADYLATNLFVRDAVKEILDALAGHGLLEHVDLDIDSIFYADMDYLDAALEAVEQECGGMDAYLAAVLAWGSANASGSGSFICSRYVPSCWRHFNDREDDCHVCYRSAPIEARGLSLHGDGGQMAWARTPSSTSRAIRAAAASSPSTRRT